jgi:hypothetical protein
MDIWLEKWYSKSISRDPKIPIDVVVNTNLPVVSYNLVGGRGISSTGY